MCPDMVEIDTRLRCRDETIFDAFGDWECMNGRSSVILKFHYRVFWLPFLFPYLLSFCCEKLCTGIISGM